MGRILYPLVGAVIGYLITVLLVVFVFKFFVGGKGLELLGFALMTYLAIGPAGAMGGMMIGYRRWSRLHTARLVRESEGDGA